MVFLFAFLASSANITEDLDTVTILSEGESELIRSIVSNIGIVNTMKYVFVKGNWLSVGESAFEACASVLEISLPDSITYFKQACFYYCTSLVKINLPQNLKSIAYRSLSFTVLGGALTFPPALTSIADWSICYVLGATKFVFTNVNLLKIVNAAFYGCGISEIDFGNCEIELSGNSFTQCSKLQSVIIGPKVTFKSHPFDYCSGLTNISVDPGNPNYVSVDNTIYSSDRTKVCLFLYTKTENYTVLDSATSVGDSCFRYAKAKQIDLRNVQFLASYAFSYSSTVVVLGSKIEEIGKNCFEYSKLTLIDLPPSLKTIGGYAFRSCTNLVSISMPDSLTSVGSTIFGGCKNLVTVTISPGNTLFSKDESSGIVYNADQSDFVFVPSTVVTVKTPLNITRIPASCFSRCTGLEKITFLGDVTNFGLNAFEFCAFTEFTFPSTLLAINSETLAYCYELKKATFPSGIKITLVAQSTFVGCKALTEVVFGEDILINMFDQNSFYSCSSLKSLTVPPTINKIEAGCFKGSGIENITITGGDLVIHPTAFQNCDILSLIIFDSISIPPFSFKNIGTLRTIQISKKVRSIGGSAFADNPRLSAIVFEDGSELTSIESNAFSNCPELVSVTLPSKIQNPTASIFTGCSSLTWVGVNNTESYTTLGGVLYNKDLTKLIVCPAGLRECYVNNRTIELGKYSFSGCLNLENIYLSTGLKKIEDYCFNECNKLNRLNIPVEIAYIGKSPFEKCDSLKTIFYCGSSDENMTTFDNKDPFPNFVNLWVSINYKGKVENKFMNHDTSITNSMDPYGCPLVPTEKFTFMKKNRAAMKLPLVFLIILLYKKF